MLISSKGMLLKREDLLPGDKVLVNQYVCGALAVCQLLTEKSIKARSTQEELFLLTMLLVTLKSSIKSPFRKPKQLDPKYVLNRISENKVALKSSPITQMTEYSMRASSIDIYAIEFNTSLTLVLVQNIKMAWLSVQLKPLLGMHVQWWSMQICTGFFNWFIALCHGLLCLATQLSAGSWSWSCTNGTTAWDVIQLSPTMLLSHLGVPCLCAWSNASRWQEAAKKEASFMHWSCQWLDPYQLWSRVETRAGECASCEHVQNGSDQQATVFWMDLNWLSAIHA